MEKAGKDNSGFSLIEVLIAVMILAIIIIPLLHSFVSAQRVNARSRQIMRATTLAQNEMEIFEKEKIADLADPGKFDYTVTGPEADGSYVFERTDISNDESGTATYRYDVVINLNPEREAAPDRYYDANTKKLLYIDTIGDLDSGSYVQPVRNSRNFNGYDENVYAWFYNNKFPSGGQENYFKTPKDFSEGLARKITVRIYQVHDGMQTNTIVKVIYDYFSPDNVMPTGCQRYTDEKIIFNNAQKLDEEGNPIELKNVYLFFAPRYDAKVRLGIGDTSKIIYEGREYKVAEDLIVIENEAVLPVNFFVVRQDILKETSDTDSMVVPAAYQPKLEIHDGLDAEGALCGTYYTNLNLDAPVGDGTGRHTWFSIYNINTGTPLYGGDPGVEYAAVGTPVRDSIRTLTGEDAKETKDRIYSMEVLVYEHGNTADPLVDMTGTKLE